MNSPTNINPFQMQFESFLKKAIDLNASDLHLEPFEKETNVRTRIDGTLRHVGKIREEKFRVRLFEQAKKLCGFDMGKTGEPQDSRFSNEALNTDFRASLIPVLHGEKIVLRIIPRSKIFSLEKTGLPSHVVDQLKDILASWQGLIVTSGPTNSGKTSLLYAMLSYLDRLTNNIMTIEDPIEFVLENINQTQINREKGLDFSQAIRAALRQDPDIILLGEIRDEETAEAALHAAQTGHLVLTTVHANNANEVIQRLVGLGLDKEVLTENLLFVSAQRLIPKLCSKCSVDDEEAKQKILQRIGMDILPRKAKGCAECNYTGENSRILLFECIHLNESNKKAHPIPANMSLSENAKQFLKEGVISYENASSFL